MRVHGQPLLGTPFADLKKDVKDDIRKYYKAVCNNQSKRLLIMARESSVQLILQNVKIIYEYFNPPTHELYYQGLG